MTHEHPFFRGPAEPTRLEPGQRIRIAGRVGTFINYRSAWPNLITWLPDGTLETESIQWSCGGVVLSDDEDAFLTEWSGRLAA